MQVLSLLSLNWQNKKILSTKFLLFHIFCLSKIKKVFFLVRMRIVGTKNLYEKQNV